MKEELDRLEQRRARLLLKLAEHKMFCNDIEEEIDLIDNDLYNIRESEILLMFK